MQLRRRSIITTTIITITASIITATIITITTIITTTSPLRRPDPVWPSGKAGSKVAFPLDFRPAKWGYDTASRIYAMR